MPTSIEPKRAAVCPRVVSETTGETVRLEDVVRFYLDKGVHRLQIFGEAGSGKTTALAHLATLPEAERFVIADDLDDTIPTLSPGKLSIHTTTDRGVAPRSIRIAPWTEDDLIEYMLGKYPEQCGTVIQRFKIGSAWQRLDGNPRLICMLADELAADTQISLDNAIANSLDRQAQVESCRRQAGLYATAKLRDASETPSRVDFRQLYESPRLTRLLEHRLVQVYFAARHFVSALWEERHTSVPMSSDLIDAVSTLVRADPDLTELVENILKVDAGTDKLGLIASVAHRVIPRWEPTSSIRHKLNLSDGDFENAIWGKSQLESITLNRANLRKAKLQRARLSRAQLSEARFDSADLSSADLRLALATQTRFCHANLSGANLKLANFAGANFSSADLRKVKASRASFAVANLSHADLSEGEFDDCVFGRAKFVGTILHNASFRHSRFHDVDLREAQLGSTDFSFCKMVCNLEGVSFENGAFKRSQLTGSVFTGAFMPNVDMHGANLSGTRLADVQWEGANLRAANLSGASFHLGSTRSGLVGSPYPSHGTRTGFYTDDYGLSNYKSPEEVRTANLQGADLINAKIEKTDFYLVDLRGAKYSSKQEYYLRQCKAILDDWV